MKNRIMYWGGLTSLAQVYELLQHVIKATYWAAERVNPVCCMRLRREAWGLAMAVSSGNRAIKEYADKTVALAKAGAISPTHFAVAWNMRQLVKKFEFGCEMSDEEAKKDFLARNEALKGSHPLPYELRSCMRRLLAMALPEPPAEGDGHYLSEGRFGPGATYEHAGNYLQKLEVCRWFREATGVPIWHGRAPGLVKPYARLQAVPKDLNRKRTITVESIVRCWGQQAVRTSILRSIHLGVLRGSVMDQLLTDRSSSAGNVDWWGRGLKRAEPRQKVRCKLGAKTGRLATIDLSNASDTMRYDDVMSVFPPWVTPLLDEVRSTHVEVNGTLYPLHMYAGMGNATTFVVETLFFWSLFTSVANIVNGRFSTALGRLRPDPRCGDVTVYGDDIVCRTANLAANPYAMNLVKQTSVVVNEDKSGYSLGPGFREACGEVSYHDVSLASTTRLYGAKGNKEGAIRYCDFASRLLESPIPDLQLLGYALATWRGAPKAPYIRTEVPDSAVLAYRVPERTNVCSVWLRETLPRMERAPKERWNSNLQRYEVQLSAVCAYERSATLTSVSPGDISWDDYQLNLLTSRTQCVEERQPTDGRRLRYPVPHRTKVRRRWVPGFCEPRTNVR